MQGVCGYASNLPSRSGFSLLEILVVMVILAIITIIAVPMHRENLVEAYAPEAEAVLAAFLTAAQRCMLENGNSFTPCDYNTLTGNYTVDTATTDKWIFSVSTTENSITVIARGNGTAVPELSDKTITITYDINQTPHERKTYSW